MTDFDATQYVAYYSKFEVICQVYRFHNLALYPGWFSRGLPIDSHRVFPLVVHSAWWDEAQQRDELHNSVRTPQWLFLHSLIFLWEVAWEDQDTWQLANDKWHWSVKMTNCLRWPCCRDTEQDKWQTALDDLVVGTRQGQMTNKKLPKWSCCRGTDQDEWKLAKEWKMINLLQGHWPGQMAGRQLCSILWWWRLVVRDTFEPS